LRAAFHDVVSENQNAEMRLRTTLARRLLAALPIGSDPNNFTALRHAGAADDPGRTGSGFIHLSYVEPACRMPNHCCVHCFKDCRCSGDPLSRRGAANFVG
jgi:hypothetical protein